MCRSSIHYTSTSLAVDNFISNLSQLIGGFIKERRESVQNAQLGWYITFFIIYLMLFIYSLLYT